MIVCFEKRSFSLWKSTLFWHVHFFYRAHPKYHLVFGQQKSVQSHAFCLLNKVYWISLSVFLHYKFQRCVDFIMFHTFQMWPSHILVLRICLTWTDFFLVYQSETKCGDNEYGFWTFSCPQEHEIHSAPDK